MEIKYLVAAQKIWDYLKLDYQSGSADVIVVMGSHDPRVAERGAELFLQGLAPLVVCSGGIGRLTEDWPRPEAEVFAEVMTQNGVPEEVIIKEDQSTNTGENIVFTKELLAKQNIFSKTVLLVHKPYMERRAYATCRKRWPEVDCLVTSPDLTLENYPFNGRSMDYMLHIMVGDLQRIKLYGDKGYAIPQDIPSDIWVAYKLLVEAGYTDYLIKDKVLSSP